MREAIDISSGPALLSTLLGLAVDPTHLRDLHAQAARAAGLRFPAADAAEAAVDTPGAERRRRVRDAVEAALSDVILLGTEPLVRLAARAARDLVAGRPVETAELVVSLRSFIREVLDLDPVPADATIPKQGPLRPSSSGRGAAAKGGGGSEDGRKTGGGGKGTGAGGGAGGGAAMLDGGGLGGLDRDGGA